MIFESEFILFYFVDQDESLEDSRKTIPQRGLPVSVDEASAMNLTQFNREPAWFVPRHHHTRDDDVIRKRRIVQAYVADVDVRRECRDAPEYNTMLNEVVHQQYSAQNSRMTNFITKVTNEKLEQSIPIVISNGLGHARTDQLLSKRQLLQDHVAINPARPANNPQLDPSVGGQRLEAATRHIPATRTSREEAPPVTGSRAMAVVTYQPGTIRDGLNHQNSHRQSHVPQPTHSGDVQEDKKRKTRNRSVFVNTALCQ